ncbi:PREDICTED: pentatricopeptide repeat-containing protein At4g02750-like [Fragaria vesca subsp. vesca]|uniref:pentatricopeptide repeat-containing protein At4g02750-like n=1 Tax=Fragaria vesca subsp. vesca TaxID=101020 RepID=UPI0002C2E82B|nr:PREDICTED: pentatricopeptide repeat-containing protein At4g02750-like [Fragaria vesca subsp. vesca]
MLYFSSSISKLKLTRPLYLTLTKSLCTGTSTPFFQTQNPTSYDLKPLNSKISNFMRNGFVEDAQKLFDEMPHRNTVTWNAMIRGYFLNGQFATAVSLFNRMKERDVFSYNTVIAGLMQCGDVEGARRVFDGMDFWDVVSWNSMISGYVRNGRIGEAVQVFEGMPVKDVVSWNLVVGGLVKYWEFDLAEEYFKKMSVRDCASWTIMISVFGEAGRIVEARELFDEMPVRDVQAWNAMIVGYIGNGCVEVAEGLFQKMPERDLESWTQMVEGLVECHRINDALKLFMEMPEKCPKTWNSILLKLTRNELTREAHALLKKMPYRCVISWTNLIVGYFGIREVCDAIKLFESMPTRDTTAWNATIFGLSENDRGEEGLRLFMRMKESGPSPDKATFTSVLTICSDLPTLHLGRQTHAHIVKEGFGDIVSVSNAMVTMYARCGSMDSALLEFSFMPIRDVISWNSIICGYAHHGNGEVALEMFECMRSTSVDPNAITFVNVLSACSHAGLVDQGKYYFDMMRYTYFLEPTTEHYTCIVDLFGRFGLIDEAMSFLDQMKSDGFEIRASVWGALLGACRLHKNIEVGEIAGERVLEIEPGNSGIYLILAEMYSSYGRREDAGRIKARMKEKGVKKQPGCSWIEVNNIGHVFLSGDKSHPKFRRICYVLELLYTDIETQFPKPNAVLLQQVQVP